MTISSFISMELSGAIGSIEALPETLGTIESEETLAYTPALKRDLLEINPQFVPFLNDQTPIIVAKPQLFLDGIAPQCGGTVLALEVENDQKTLRCSNQHAIHGDDKIMRKLYALFSNKQPISEDEAWVLIQEEGLSNPSGIILFIVDHATRAATIVVDGPENLKNVFKTQETFDAWIQEATQRNYPLEALVQGLQEPGKGKGLKRANALGVVKNALRIPKKINAVARKFSGGADKTVALPTLSHLLGDTGTYLKAVAGGASRVLSPIGTVLDIASVTGFDEVAKNAPKLLYPAGKSEQSQLIVAHGKIVMSLVRALSKGQNIKSDLGSLAHMSDCIHFYNVQRGLLSEEWRQNFKELPQAVMQQLAFESGRDVCCLVITSGRFVCPNFFQTLYVCRWNPMSGEPALEVVKARGLKDDRVVNAFGEKCTLEELANNQTLCLLIDQKLQQIYIVSYEPHGTPQFPNIFTPENWKHWKKVFSPIWERLKDSGELLRVSWGEKIRKLPGGNYIADKLGLKRELSTVEALKNTLINSERKHSRKSTRPTSKQKIGFEKDDGSSSIIASFNGDEFQNLQKGGISEIKEVGLSRNQ